MNMNVRAKKELGQHFLTDLGVAEQIAMALPLDRTKKVLEVGPGMGVLTQFLIERSSENIDLTVVEIDTESVAYLNRNFPAGLAGRIVEGDFLQMAIDGETSVIGNFPYNISTQIFFKILDNRDSVPYVVGMLQKEVAARLAAPAGTRDGGVLSILLQAFYDVEYLFEVGPSKFSPPPKVDSAVIRCTRNGVTDLGCDEKLFKRVVKGAFAQRRKMLRNAIYASFQPIAEAKLDHPFFKRRAENLSIAEFVELTVWIKNNL
ncbi:MAG: 16S rRNA (adenine(1518)-N(6)/adenine(1519)-N(6))-dimethyltransferase RsmA [Mucinivorans sp.]